MPRAFRLEAVKKVLEHSKRRGSNAMQRNPAGNAATYSPLITRRITDCIAAALFRALAAAEQRETFAAHVCHATGGSAGHAVDENY